VSAFLQFCSAGGSPAADFFFLRRQEKEIKKKATPVCRANLSDVRQAAYP
jgi:hypothetical protein